VLNANEECSCCLLEMSSDASMIQAGGTFIKLNTAAVKMFGAKSPEQLIGKPIVNFIRSNPGTIRMPGAEWPNIATLIGRITQVDGTVLDVEIIEKPCMYQGRPSITIVLRILAEDQYLEPSLPFLAQYDALTKLPNHRQFRDRLNGAIARAVRNQQKVAVILLSVNHFKTMNAKFGYQTGDFVLDQIASSIKQCLREGDTAARLGGDEFSIVLEGLTQRDGAGVVAQRLLKVLSLPLVYDGQEITFTLSIGIALFTDDSTGPELLIQNAELALYHAKKSEPNTYQFYTADMDDLHMRNTLRHSQIEQRFARLTPREREVMEMMITGDTSKMIAYRLGVSNRTIESHRAHIIDKMQADSLPDLIRMIFDRRK